jgi:hypothetical protein
MASGTINLGTSGNIKGRITWSSKSNGTAANSSAITATIQVARTDSYTTTGTWSGYLSLNGTNYNFSLHTSVSSGWKTLLTKTITKAHADSGKGTCAIGGRIAAPSGTSQAGNVVSGSATVTLDTIPRKAAITSAPNFNDEANPVIKYSNPAGNAVTKLEACISLTGAADDVAYREISKSGTSYTFSLTAAERNVLLNATSGKNRKVRFYIQTTIGSAVYRDYVEVTFSITNANPTISNLRIIDSNEDVVAVTQDTLIFVKDWSIPKVTANLAAVKGAKLKTLHINGKAHTLNNAATQSINLASKEYNTNDGKFTIQVTDTRGFSTTTTQQLYYNGYKELTCNVSSDSKPTVEGVFKFTISGNYHNAHIGNSNNGLSLAYRYTEKNGTYSEMLVATPIISGNTYSAEVTLTGLDYRKAYTIEAYASDKLMTTSSKRLEVSSYSIFDWDADSFAFHTPLFLDNTKQIWWKDTEDNNVLMISLNASNQAFFGYGTYNANLGSTYFDGNNVHIRSKNAINCAATGNIGGNKAWTNSSDSRLKEDIRDLPQVFCNIWLEVQPKLFRFNELNGGGNTLYFGLIAQDVIAAFEKYGLNYKDYAFVSVLPIEDVEYFAITYEAYNMITAQVLKNTIAEVESIKKDLAAIKARLGAM